jgi:hypothetical protein
MERADTFDSRRKISEKCLAAMQKSADNPVVKELATTASALLKTLGTEASSAIAVATLGVLARPLASSLYGLLQRFNEGVGTMIARCRPGMHIRMISSLLLAALLLLSCYYPASELF